MIKCISYWSMKDGLAGTHPIDDALATAKREGFAGIELCIGTGGALSVDSTKADCTAIRKQVDASGLVLQTLASGMTWGCNPVSNDASVRKQALALNKKVLERAAWLGCEAVLCVPGVVNSPICPEEHVRYDHAVQRATETVKQLLDVTEKVNVDLCIENVWNGLFYSPVEMAQFVDSFKHPKLGVYFDVGNGLGYQQWPPHWIELLGRRIRRVHIKDYKENFNWLGAYSFCDLGSGMVPWTQTMSALRAIGYDRTLVAEMMPWDPSLLSRTSKAMDHIMSLSDVKPAAAKTAKSGKHLFS